MTTDDKLVYINTPNFLTLFPNSPGIYMMKNDQNEIIYVGKAKNIKNRLRSYFQKNNRDLKTKHLIQHTLGISTIATKTEKEALILEKQLIETHQPKYNINLKDDKSFPYIKITTNEAFPRILITREPTKDNSLYFGPYPSIGSTKMILQFLLDIFPLRTCKKAIDPVIKQSKCIRFDINKCLAPCINKDLHKKYLEMISELTLLLAGKNSQLITRLENKMKALARIKQFEKAAYTRNQINKIVSLGEKQHITFTSNKHLLVCNSAQNNNYFYVLMQTYLAGKLQFQQGYYTDKTKNSISFMHDFVIQSLIKFWNNVDMQIQEIVISSIFEESKNVLITILPPKVKLIFPKRGLKLQLVELAQKNASLALNRLLTTQTNKSSAKPANDLLSALQQILELNFFPHIIVGFDISHLAASNIVGSAVVFENGVPLKSAYRKFKLKSVRITSDDPQAIYEIVRRYLSQKLKTQEVWPSLLIIDGGIAQFNAAKKAISELHLEHKLDVLAIAKKFETIYANNLSQPLNLKENSDILKLMQRIRDEAHRFAVSFQRNKRTKDALDSVLNKINGLGKKRIELIYLKYASLEELSRGQSTELAKIGNMGLKVAKRIKKQIKPYLR
jgi:excinuclease ABC subunit C